MRIRIQPVKGELGRGSIILTSSSLAGTFVMSDTEVPLDADAAWTRAVCEIVASQTGGEFSKGRVLRLVREARTVAIARGWKP